MASEMAEVDRVIRLRLESEVPLVNQVSQYIIGAGGKRIRPLLLLLFSNALGFSGEERFELAAAVEFIHTATLLHDDVVDESVLRRGTKTANAAFGNAASVLVGDFIYSRAFQMIVSANRLEILAVLAEATNVIAEGEVLQLMNMHDPNLSVDDYLRVIKFKTAKLFEASARIGAVLAGVSAEVEEYCAAYGRGLGTAFQLIDDVLDYDGEVDQLGKGIGNDLREGKPTLPLLIAMERSSGKNKDLIRSAISNGDSSQFAKVLALVRSTDALEATRESAKLEVARAIHFLNNLPDSSYKQALIELSLSSLGRVG